LHLLPNYHYTEAVRPPRFFIGACAGDQKSFDEFIRDQFQALIYAFLVVVFIGSHAFATLRFGYLFIKKKVRAPLAAVSRGKIEQGEKSTIVILNAVKNLSVKDPSCLRMTENCRSKRRSDCLSIADNP